MFPSLPVHTHTGPIIFLRILSFCLGDLGIGPQRLWLSSSGWVIMRLWLKMDFSFWSRTALQLLLRMRKGRGVLGAQGLV